MVSSSLNCCCIRIRTSSRWPRPWALSWRATVWLPFMPPPRCGSVGPYPYLRFPLPVARLLGLVHANVEHPTSYDYYFVKRDFAFRPQTYYINKRTNDPTFVVSSRSKPLIFEVDETFLKWTDDDLTWKFMVNGDWVGDFLPRKMLIKRVQRDMLGKMQLGLARAAESNKG